MLDAVPVNFKPHLSRVIVVITSKFGGVSMSITVDLEIL